MSIPSGEINQAVEWFTTEFGYFTRPPKNSFVDLRYPDKDKLRIIRQNLEFKSRSLGKVNHRNTRQQVQLLTCLENVYLLTSEVLLPFGRVPRPFGTTFESYCTLVETQCPQRLEEFKAAASQVTRFYEDKNTRKNFQGNFDLRKQDFRLAQQRLRKLGYLTNAGTLPVISTWAGEYRRVWQIVHDNRMAVSKEQEYLQLDANIPDHHVPMAIKHLLVNLPGPRLRRGRLLKFSSKQTAVGHVLKHVVRHDDRPNYVILANDFIADMSDQDLCNAIVERNLGYPEDRKIVFDSSNGRAIVLQKNRTLSLLSFFEKDDRALD